jgi:hypothetical protein
MDTPSASEHRVLLALVLVALVAVIVMVIALVRSGRPLGPDLLGRPVRPGESEDHVSVR